MFEPKYVVRKGTLFNRRMLSDSIWEARNTQLCHFANAFLRDHQIHCFHVFLPIRHNKEADLWSVVREAFHRGDRVIVSATDFQNKTMNHFWYTSELAFEDDSYGIPTPVDGEPASLDQLQLIFIPMLAGDKLGNRIGYGKGYYDRLLAEMPTSLIKMGISLNPLFDRFTFAAAHDIALDYVITPHELIKCIH